MDHWELRRPREIEQMLRTDDPELAERLGAVPTRTADNRVRRLLNELMVAGGWVAVLGLLVHPMLFAVGLSIVLTGFWMRVGMARLDRRHTANQARTAAAPAPLP